MRLESLKLIRYAIISLSVVWMFTMYGQQVSTTDQYVWEIPRAGGNKISEPIVAPFQIKPHEDLPVSYSTGVANISIPLLSLPGGEVNVDLFLSYQAGRGIKYNDFSNGIGLGWSLSGLGQITRQINGFPDEWRGDSSNPVEHNVKESYADVPYHLSIIEASIDAEEDYYTYDFAGYHGSFLVLPSGKITMLPQSDIVIERESNASNDCATDAFIITTPDGKRYRFAEKTKISYKENNSPMSLPKYIHDFSNATISWQLSSITGPDGCDKIEISYRDKGSWSRMEQSRLISDGFSYCLDYTFAGMGFDLQYRPFFERGKCSLTGVSTTTYSQQLVPYSIVSRSGSIKIYSTSQSSAFDTPYFIYGMSLYDAEGILVESITFDNSELFLDHRRRLDQITKKSDGVIIDKYSFNYKDTPSSDGYDLFGFKNGSGDTYSVLDRNMELSSNRKTYGHLLTGGTLSSFTDIKGLETVFEYESSTINVPETYSSQIFCNEVIIGIRLKNITTQKEGENSTIKRSFTYEDPVCNIELKDFRKQHFLSYSGCHHESINGHYTYYMGICHTPSLHAKGVSLERAQIYYGTVTEDFDNGNVHTIYEYNLDYIKNRCASGSPYPPHYAYPLTIGPERKDSPFLGDFSNISGLTNEDQSMLQYHDPYGVIEEHFGAEPKIKKITEYILTSPYTKEHSPRKVTQYYYRSHDETRVLTGMYAESRNFKYRGVFDFENILNIQEYYDYASIPIHVNANRVLCDSITTTEYFTVDNKEYTRSTKKKFINWTVFLPEADDFKVRYPDKHLQEYSFPVGSQIYCGDESVMSYYIPSEYSEDNVAYNAAKRGQKRLPTLNKVIYNTINGSDSIRTHYTYSNFDSDYGPITRLKSYYSTGTPYNNTGNVAMPRDTIFKHIYSQYDRLGRICEMYDDGGNYIRASWSTKYDNLEYLEYPDVNLAKHFEYKPLVGCTKIIQSSGKVVSYSYKAGRLESEYNSNEELMASYEYHLAKDETETEPQNSVTSTIFDDGGESYQKKIYNEKGLPTAVYYSATESNDLRYHMYYDNQNRLITQTLPVPKNYTTDTDDINDARCYHYATYAGNFSTYNDYKCNRSISVKNPHKDYYGKAETTEYLCNTTSNPLYQCLRYRLVDNHQNGESVYIDKLYPPGALDVVKVTDPEGHVVLTFSDWRGLKVMERKVVDADKEIYADTRWIYDARGNIRVIIQPEGSSLMNSIGKTWTLNDDELYELAFVYRYDTRGNCTYSKLPGAEPTEYRYDRFNRLYMKATSTRGDAGNYELTLYDPIGREAIRLVCQGDLAPVDKNIVAKVNRINGTGGICESGYELTDSWLSDYINEPSPLMTYYYDSYEDLPNEFVEVLGDNAYDICNQYAKGNLTAVKKVIYGYAIPSIYPAKESPTDLYTGFEYDIEGRVIRSIESSLIPDALIKTGNSFSRQGHPLTQTTTLELEDSIHAIYRKYAYDKIGLLTGESYILKSLEKDSDQLGNQLLTTITHKYDELGNHVGETINNNTTYNYKYNLRSQLSEITTPIFHQNIYYEEGGDHYLNGNISQITQAIADETVINRTYNYDNLNRLSETKTSDHTDTHYTYSLNSSPLTIQRQGILSDGESGIVDELALTYRGNQLIKVEDSADPVILENSMDFDTSSAEYEYDSDGRLIYDTSRGIRNIAYNSLDLPIRIDLSNVKIHYCYNADGQKLSTKKVVNHTYHTPPRKRETIYYYVGPFEIECINLLGNENFTLSRVNMPWGYYDGAKRSHYYHKDWQGNICVVTDQDGNTEQTTAYYPYGMPMTTSTGATVNPYKFSSKELETESGLNHYDFGARWLLAQLPLFTTPDPKASDYPDVNPYLYCKANPINYTDPTGERPTEYEAALMADVAYNIDLKLPDDLKNSGWTISNFKSSIKMNYTSFLENGLQSVLFEKTIDGVTEYAYAFAGTNSMEDLLEDVVQVIGIAPQYNTAINNARTLSMELGTNELTFIGHSLGGGEAAASSMATGRAAITFNPAAVSSLTKTFYNLIDDSNITNYRTIASSSFNILGNNISVGGCFVNNLQDNLHMGAPGRTINVPVSGHNPFTAHKLRNFINLLKPK